MSCEEQERLMMFSCDGVDLLLLLFFSVIFFIEIDIVILLYSVLLG